MPRRGLQPCCGARSVGRSSRPSARAGNLAYIRLVAYVDPVTASADERDMR